MVFSDPTGKGGIIQRATFQAFGDSNDHTTSWPIADMTASANRWVQKVSTWIWRATGIWEMDDFNQTDLPVATTSLIAAQHDYSLPTNNFKLKRVEVQAADGTWRLLKQLEMREIPVALDDFYSVDSLPSYYTMRANSIYLHPAPDSTSVILANGLKIYFTRDFLTFNVPTNYTTADATEPGFDEGMHDIVTVGMAYDWCIANGPSDRADRYGNILKSFQDELFQHYAVRDGDKPTKIIPHRQLYR